MTTAAQRTPGTAYRAGFSPDAPLFVAPLAATYTKAVDPRRLAVTSILTYPVPDLAGDEVRSDGGDWRVHKARPWVGIEHLRYHGDSRDRAGLIGQPGVGTEPVVVAWARESLSNEGAPHAVELKSFRLDDGNSYVLPVGTSYFDPHDRLSAQTFALIERDALPGVSLEFVPVQKSRRLERSPLESRPAYHFDRWQALAWAHCRTPVNPGALVCKSLDVLMKAVSDRRVGAEAMHPVLFKALSRHLPEPTRTTVRVETKAMPDPNAAPETAYDDPNAAPGADAAPPLNGVQALLNHAQAMVDLAGQLEADIQSSDSPELRRAAAMLTRWTHKIAGKAGEIANKHDAKLSGKEATEVEGEELEEDEDEDDSELEEDEDAEAPETDDEGVLKSVRACYRPQLLAAHKAVAVRRISLAEVRKAKPEAAIAAPVSPAADEPADSPEDIAALERAIKLHQRALKRHGA